MSHCDCGDQSCMECGGGMHTCTVCGGFEGLLTEDCCGSLMSDEQVQRIISDELDFRRSQGGWTTWTRYRELANKGLTL